MKELYLGSERDIAVGTVILNVGGAVHQVKWETINKFPKSRLQKLRYATFKSKLFSPYDSDYMIIIFPIYS